MKERANFILDLYPTTKFLFAIIAIISIFVFPSYLYGYGVALLCFVIAACAGRFSRFSWIVFKTLFILVLFIFVFQMLFSPGTTVLREWWIFQIKADGIQFGLQLTSRVLAIGCSFILFFETTRVKDFVRSLVDLGLSSTASYIVLATMQIIPEMSKQAATIMDAQKTRGVETEGNVLVRAKAFLPSLGPLVLSSLSSTEERAITLEARAFSAPVKKTHMFELPKTQRDKAIEYGLIFLLILLVAGRLLL